MLKLNNINLIRTSSYYRSDTIKSFVIDSIMSPFKSLAQRPYTEFFLKDINLTISAGERVAILGKNGSGKSTLCRLIAGQLFASSGLLQNPFSVSIFSQIDHSFFKELSGRENLKYFIKFIYRQKDALVRQQLLEDACLFSELGPALDRLTETYSTGMLSRLALSLILVQKHDLLILDEMQAHADFGFREKVGARLKDIIESSNIVLMVSHHPEEVLSSCKRGLVIENGKIHFDGPIEKAVAVNHLLSKGGSLV